MFHKDTTFNATESSHLPVIFPDIVERLHDIGVTPHPFDRPSRCRTIIFDPSGSAIILIRRDRPDRPEQEPYYVFPGGKLEDVDMYAVDGAMGEMYEETSIKPDRVVLTGKVLEYRLQDEYFFLGVANELELTLALAPVSPEIEKDPAIFGTYSPVFMPVEQLAGLRIFPQTIAHEIVAMI